MGNTIRALFRRIRAQMRFRFPSIASTAVTRVFSPRRSPSYIGCTAGCLVVLLLISIAFFLNVLPIAGDSDLSTFLDGVDIATPAELVGGAFVILVGTGGLIRLHLQVVRHPSMLARAQEQIKHLEGSWSSRQISRR